MKSKYISSEYKRPLCIDIEDVKLKQTTVDEAEGDLVPRSQTCVKLEAKREAAKKKYEGDDLAGYAKSVKEYSTQLLEYLMQFLPPTAMIVLQVNIYPPFQFTECL